MNTRRSFIALAGATALSLSLPTLAHAEEPRAMLDLHVWESGDWVYVKEGLIAVRRNQVFVQFIPAKFMPEGAKYGAFADNERMYGLAVLNGEPSESHPGEGQVSCDYFSTLEEALQAQSESA